MRYGGALCVAMIISVLSDRPDPAFAFTSIQGSWLRQSSALLNANRKCCRQLHTPFRIQHGNLHDLRILKSGPHCRRHSTKVFAGKDETLAGDLTTPIPEVEWTQYAWFLVALPVLANIFPFIVDSAQAATVPEDRRFLIILFLILKRVYLYSLALSTLDIAARRSVNSVPELGKRLQKLNEEIFGTFLPRDEIEKAQKGEIASQAYQSLDTMDTSAQAAFLPAFLTVALLGSYLAITLGQQPPPSAALDAAPFFGTQAAQALAAAFRSLSPALVPLSNAAVCVLFTSTELSAAFASLRRRLPSALADSPAASAAPLAAAGLLVGWSFLAPAAAAWPIRNVVNGCLAVTAARAVQLPQLTTVALALGGLVFYDVAGVYLLPTAGAEDAVAGAATAAAAAAPSVMESVARAKLQAGGGWQPGLLTVAVDGRVTDALGLADVVFPSMLAGWAFRRDAAAAAAAAATVPTPTPAEQGAQRPGPAADEAAPPAGGADLTAAAAGGGAEAAPAPAGAAAAVAAGAYGRAALAGYAVGCLACEITNSGGGQPALLYLVPAMFATVLSVAAARGELGAVWAPPRE